MEDRYGLLEELRITVLIEDYAGYDSGLLGQHGTSILLEASAGQSQNTILFDTGQTAEPVLHNMKLLGKDPAGIDMIVLSHCHFDHTGGLIGILGAGGFARIPVIAHPSIYRANFSLKPKLRSVGMDPESSREAVANKGGELILTEEPLPLMSGVVTSGEIRERAGFEQTPTLSLLTVKNGKMVPDLMADDLSLTFILPRGLVIVTGCSHAGIIGIVNTATRLTGVEHIAAVIGGFHLIDADQERINRTVDELMAVNPDQVFTGHCTGLKAEAKMLERFGDRFRKLHTGMKITL